MVACGDIVLAHGVLIKLPDNCVPGIIHYELDGVKCECYARELHIALVPHLFRRAGHQVPSDSTLVYHDGVWIAEHKQVHRTRHRI